MPDIVVTVDLMANLGSWPTRECSTQLTPAISMVDDYWTPLLFTKAPKESLFPSPYRRRGGPIAKQSAVKYHSLREYYNLFCKARRKTWCQWKYSRVQLLCANAITGLMQKRWQWCWTIATRWPAKYVRVVTWLASSEYRRKAIVWLPSCYKEEKTTACCNGCVVWGGQFDDLRVVWAGC